MLVPLFYIQIIHTRGVIIYINVDDKLSVQNILSIRKNVLNQKIFFLNYFNFIAYLVAACSKLSIFSCVVSRQIPFVDDFELNIIVYYDKVYYVAYVFYLLRFGPHTY